MKKTDKDKISFWTPLDIIKSTDKKGNVQMKIKGLASTADEDADEEFLDPKGFDLSMFKSQGILNWHHKSGDDPSAIIGEPTAAKITKRGLEIEGMLYADSKKARSVYALAQTLQKNSTTRRLGFSIEGKVLERDEFNPKIIKKAKITGCAITHMPKNSNTFMEIVKGEYENPYPDYEFNGDNDEDVLTKAEIYEKIFSDFSGITKAEAEDIYNQIILNMKKSIKKPAAIAKGIQKQDVEKAYDALGLFDEQDNLQKGEDDEDEDESDDESVEETDETEDEETDESEESTEEDEEEAEEKPIKKGKSFAALKKPVNAPAKKTARPEVGMNDILKAVEFQSVESTTMFKALGEILKRNAQEIDELKSLLETTPNARKTITKSFVEKSTFKKGIDNDEENTVSCSSNRADVLDLLDQATFEKGYDAEFGKAMTAFEAGQGISKAIVSKIKTKFNVQIVD